MNRPAYADRYDGGKTSNCNALWKSQLMKMPLPNFVHAPGHPSNNDIRPYLKSKDQTVTAILPATISLSEKCKK